MLENNFQAAVFDLDGTLLYTLEDLVDSLSEVLKEEGLPQHTLEEYRMMVGNGLEMLVVRALPEGMRIPAHVRPIMKKFMAVYRERQVTKTRPYDGIVEMLESLQARGIRLAVLSNKAHPNTQMIVEHYFPGIFEAVIGMRPDVPPKPDPAGAFEIAEIMGISPENFLYLGDSDVDMKTALAAGMTPVGVSWGFRPPENLLEAGAAAIIDSPLQFAEMFEDDGDCQMPELPPLNELVIGRLTTDPPAWAIKRPDIIDKLKSRPGRIRPALTGGVASGKSTAAAMFMELGAGHIDFDILARRAIEPGSRGHAETVALLGERIVKPDGQLDRRLMGEIIFSDPELKAALENIIHPRAWELMGEELDALEEKPVVVISVPLLFEAGLETFFSPVIMVFTHPDIQLERLTARNPELGQAGAESIIANQWPSPPKVMGSTFVINNNGDQAEARGQVEAVWKNLINLI